MSAELHVSVERLSVSYLTGRGLGKERFLAVRDVSFTIKKNRCLALVGESGSGKSTIAKAILGLADIESGEVRVGGFRRPGLPKKQEHPFRREVQVVFQDPYLSLNPRLSVRTLIEEPLKIHGTPASQRRKRLEDIVRQVHLEPELLNARPQALSGGQRQRVCIARALILDPGFLIADEPVSALDLSVQAQIVDLLSVLRKERGLTMLFVSHDIELVQFLADDVAVLYGGQLMEIGPGATLLSAPEHPYTTALLDAVPTRLSAQSLICDDTPPRHNPAKSGCPYRSNCPKAHGACSVFPEPRRRADGGTVFCHWVGK